jgi:aminobenzoyl-glutamate utilization protein B
MRPTQRAHRTITMGGIQPNIIPDLGQTWWFVRDANAPWAKENFDKLVNIAKGAALMTGTTMDMEVVASAWPQLGNKALSEAISKNIDAVGMPKWSDEEEKFARDFQKSLNIPVVGLARQRIPGNRPQSFASNDSGDVTWNVPSGNLSFPAAVPGVGAHNWQAGVTPTMSISHKGQVAGAKVIAASVLDMLTDPKLMAAAKAEFDQQLKQTPYFSFLPPDAKPDTSMNKEVMDRLRPEMTKFYLNKKATFK